MSRMTVSIKRINEHLDKISGLDGEASDIMQNVLEPLVELICSQIYKASIFCIDEKEWTSKWIVDEFGHKCSKCEEYLESGDDELIPQFCPSCGRATTPDALAVLEERMRERSE